MKRKYLYYSKYKINGLECHEFDEIIIPINHEWVREVYISDKNMKCLLNLS